MKFRKGSTIISCAGLLLVMAPLIATKRTCPLEKDLIPCRCQSRNKGGVDLTCERASLDAITRALDLMRETEQTIVYLKLRQSKIGHLPDNIFDNLDVKHIIMTNSSLTSVGKSAFAGLDNKLETMDLSQNQLRQIPREALSKLHALVTLAINHNHIDEIPAKAFEGHQSLLRLSLFGNQIKTIDAHAFDGVDKKLARLNLGSNQLSSVPTDAIKGLQKLEWLELQDNRVTHISKQYFQASQIYDIRIMSGLSELNLIDLTNNLIEELPSETFGNEIRLNSLTLEGNLIENIVDDAFKGIEGTLEWLKLGDNKLNQIPSHALRRLVKLKQLDLHSNNISHIPEDAFDEFGSHLKFLGLQKNNIDHVPTMAFFNMHTLQWLYLGENQVKRFPLETYEPIIDTLNNFDIHNNPLVCDCELRWFREWLSNEGKKILTFSEDTQCNEPTPYKDYVLNSIPVDHLTCPMYYGEMYKYLTEK
uniref:LRRCT domain-containing protein n=1 Tax=Strigamia maritima TaxID=126957 RepID=T1J2L8_STRMM